MGSQVDVHGAAELDLEAGNAQGLRELLNSPVVSIAWQCGTYTLNQSCIRLTF